MRIVTLFKKGVLSLLTVLVFGGIIGLPDQASAAANPSAIVNFGKKFVGTPYSFGGNNPKGFDCSGFITYTYKNNGISLPRTAAEQFNRGEAVDRKQLQAGDLVFFQTYKKGASHVGIYIGDNKFLHADTSKGIAVSSLNDPYYWKSRYLGARRVI